jgi:hypothetical protein
LKHGIINGQSSSGRSSGFLITERDKGRKTLIEAETVYGKEEQRKIKVCRKEADGYML